MKKYHYVYEIFEKSTGLKYIGSRSSDILPEDDLGKKYFSSASKSFRQSQKSNPCGYRYTILSTHEDRSCTNIEESRLHKILDVMNNESYINKMNAPLSGFSFIQYGKMCVIDKDGKHYQVDIDDPRVLSGELMSHSTGKLTVIDKDGKYSSVSLHDPRYLSGELKAFSHNKVVVKNDLGETFHVDIDDERYLSGEFTALLKGVPNDSAMGSLNVRDSDGNGFRVSKDDARYIAGELVPLMKGVPCLPNRGMTFVNDNGRVIRLSKEDPRVLSRELNHVFHGMVVAKHIASGEIVHATKEEFDKNDVLVGHTHGSIRPTIDGTLVVTDGVSNFRVGVDDPRYLSGKFISVTTGNVMVKDSNGNILQVKKNDPRYVSGELVHVFRGMAVVKDKAGNILHVDKNDPRIKSGELVSNAKDKATVRDKEGNVFQIDKNDPRYINGELVSSNTGRIAINNGVINRKIMSSEEIPEGWKRGFVKKTCF